MRTDGIDGALTTCGIVAGAINLNNYQLDGEYAMSRLLAPDEAIKLVHFTDPGDGLNTGYQLDAVASQAQATPQGRARLALAMAFMNVTTWAAGRRRCPRPTTTPAQEQRQYDVQFEPAAPPISTTMDFVEFGRPYIEQAAGGNGSWTAGVDFARLLARSPYGPEVPACTGRPG